MIPDLINAAFECLGVVAVGLSIAKLCKDRKVAGVHWGMVAFFFSWGCWNMFYYPYLDQWYSTAGAVLTAVANGIYLALILKWRNN